MRDMFIAILLLHGIYGVLHRLPILEVWHATGDFDIAAKRERTPWRKIYISTRMISLQGWHSIRKNSCVKDDGARLDVTTERLLYQLQDIRDINEVAKTREKNYLCTGDVQTTISRDALLCD